MSWRLAEERLAQSCPDGLGAEQRLLLLLGGRRQRHDAGRVALLLRPGAWILLDRSRQGKALVNAGESRRDQGGEG